MGERGRRWICATIVVTLLAACSGGNDDGGGTGRPAADATSGPSTTQPTGTSEAPATTAPQTPEGEITADYLAYWAAYDRLAADPGSDPDAAALAEHASGQAIAGARQSLDELRSRGQRIELGPSERHHAYAPAVIDAQTAYIADCHIADARVVDAGGEVVRSDPPGGRPETIAVNLVRSGDGWLVDGLQYYDLAPGETCSASGPVPR